MTAFTGKGLVKYAEAQLGKGYWYGTYGQIASEPLYQQKKKQYPTQYEKWTKASFSAQYGQKVHDCAGLVKGYLMTPNADIDPSAPAVYDPKYDYSANGMIKLCKEQGSFASIPPIAGLVVWKNNHMGIYTGTGKNVIEAKGHAAGVVRTTDTKWEKWGKLPWLSYEETPAPTPAPEPEACVLTLPILRKGDKRNEVGVVQVLLRWKGYKGKNGLDLTVDNSFGGNTEFAVSTFQRKNGLEVTGTVNAKTWSKLTTISYA